MRIYVGNLSYETSEDQLRTAFEEFGKVESVSIIKDKFSGKSKGFGFIDMNSDEEGNSAIEGMNDKEFMGRKLNVNEARPQKTGRRDSRDGSRNSRGGKSRGSDSSRDYTKKSSFRY